MGSSFRYECIVSQPFAENTYVLWRDGQREALVIDPGLEPDLIQEFLEQEKLKVAAILNTHGHGDHIGGNTAMKEAFPDAPLMIGKNDAFMLSDPVGNVSLMFGVPITSPPADRLLSEGDVVEFAGITLDVFDLPGHSPGHIVFHLNESPIISFCGDTLMPGGIGRTDFPGGNLKQLLSGIQEKLLTLPDDTVLCAGHGPVSTIGTEKQTNPLLGEGGWFE